MKNYQLLQSGNGEKIERFGPYVLRRPCSQAVWRMPQHQISIDAEFNRDEKWRFFQKLPKEWTVEHQGVQFQISPTDFGHLGLFPEHGDLWQWMRPHLKKGKRLLNLFAYSGGVSLAAAQEGAEVCHLDASKGMVDWARQNAQLNKLEKAPIRWIVDDAIKFLRREKKRNSLYDAIVLDPPTFGRGSQGEVFKIENDILPLLDLCRDLLTKEPLFMIFSCHTPGFTPLCMEHLMRQTCSKGTIETGEMVLPNALSIPSGSFARWIP